MHSAVISMPFGRFGIRCSDRLVEELVFLPPDTPLRPPAGALAVETAAQLEAWLADPDFSFSLPLAPAGTAFQRRVWHAISAIPRGHCRQYGSLAAELGSAARAVGQACGANPFPIVVPCHRVVAANGLGGFAGARDGYLIAAKRWLLAFEAAG